MLFLVDCLVCEKRFGRPIVLAAFGKGAGVVLARAPVFEQAECHAQRRRGPQRRDHDCQWQIADRCRGHL